MIEFIDVGMTYPGGNVGLKNINLTINKSEITVFIGPSGSGKTTLLKMINRLEDNTTGEVKINGKNVKEYNIHKMRWDIGYALQQVALFPHMNVEENIAIVPELKKWKKEKINARIDELLNMVGLELEKFRKRKPLCFSLQVQRSWSEKPSQQIEKEKEHLEMLYQRGVNNGVPEMEIIDAAEIQKRELM